MIALLSWLLRTQNLERLDGRGPGKQFGRLRHERLGDRTLQMRLPSVFVGKRVENAERSPPQAQSEPEGRCGLLFCQRRPGFQELCDFVFLAGLGFQSCEQSDLVHSKLLKDLPDVPANEAADGRAMTRQTVLYTPLPQEKRGVSFGSSSGLCGTLVGRGGRA